jgi:hypothetical protein
MAFLYAQLCGDIVAKYGTSISGLLQQGISKCAQQQQQQK